MIDLLIDELFIPDLKDDFIMNNELDLYEFIDNDPVTAYYLGYNITDWFPLLEKEQQYLYSKQIRHCRDNLEKYDKQIKFWTKKFANGDDEVDLNELAEYILNNIFIDNDKDLINLAFFLGKVTFNTSNKDGNKLLQERKTDQRTEEPIQGSN